MFFFIFLTKSISFNKMKKITLLLILVLFTTLTFGQKREKIKGSKLVTVEPIEIKAFENLEVEDNIEVFLIKGTQFSLEIEADNNLHNSITITPKGNTLRISSSKDVFGYKKFAVRITYTNNFKMLVAKQKSIITTLNDLELDSFTFKCFDYSKIFANVKVKSFTLMANDKSKIELNLKAENVFIELSKNAELKALLSSTQIKLDMYQKTIAVVEGDATDLKIRLDNNAEFTGRNLTSKNTEIVTEANTSCSVNSTTNALIMASGKSEIQFYGDAKIELTKFTENAVIMKKSL